ncbi:putative uncharacterized protein BRD3OS [Betta splendens]|uniref:Uncharacterized protein n=1 Tax=Betta splendens TaxID=158456 RepID=A0A6P7NEC1_BETSP|nr:putative uncharacterized protein BRD3OS [Betta splendens]XP_055367282.1 putative uncharacterized protein BRD3OS [Betta splendens]
MTNCDPPVIEDSSSGTGPACFHPLAEKAMSESYLRMRYQDTSLLIWQQQQQDLEAASPSTYLNRSQSTWYSSYGNQAVLIRDKRGLQDSEGLSRICRIM